jgi:carboxyl-terminal processing protease
VTEITRQTNLTGVLLDVRNNPGGYLDGAVDISSEFIPDGLIVSQEGREKTQKYTVNRKGRLTTLPVEVLMNKGSASASEIVAGALRDRRQAKLIGENSFGKGTVQDAMELGGGAGLHVTVGRWVLPGGDWIHEKGLPPNVEIADDPNTPEDEVINKAMETL